MKILLILTMVISMLACETRPKFNQNDEIYPEEYQLKWAMSEFGRLADSTFTDSTDLKSILDFKTIDLKGRIKSVSMETALKLYIANIEKENPDLYPIFEIKNTSKVILSVFGEGLWDKLWSRVVLDKESMKVLDIGFSHKGETPGFGANINDSTFTTQFHGSIVNLSPNNYALYQNDKKVMEGKQKIDGLSGATITSKGAIEMLNNDLVKYQNYLR